MDKIKREVVHKDRLITPKQIRLLVALGVKAETLATATRAQANEAIRLHSKADIMAARQRLKEKTT